MIASALPTATAWTRTDEVQRLPCTAVARNTARYMAPLLSGEGDRLLVPVPLHRAGAVILVDGAMTAGSTAKACARIRKRACAASVELVSWARVVKVSQLMR